MDNDFSEDMDEKTQKAIIALEKNRELYGKKLFEMSDKEKKAFMKKENENMVAYAKKIGMVVEKIIPSTDEEE